MWEGKWYFNKRRNNRDGIKLNFEKARYYFHSLFISSQKFCVSSKKCEIIFYCEPERNEISDRVGFVSIRHEKCNKVSKNYEKKKREKSRRKSEIFIHPVGQAKTEQRFDKNLL